jgi:hypothetical protein
MRVARRRAIAGGCLAVFAAVAAGGAAGIAGFAGVWVRDARERDDAARDVEIVRVTEPMSFAIRGFARGVMRQRMVPPERYVVEQTAGTPVIREDAGGEFPLDGQEHATAKDSAVTSSLRGGAIEQSWSEGPDSHGTTVWRLRDDGRLVVSQRVYDSHFGGPLEYSTTYRRAEAE